MASACLLSSSEVVTPVRPGPRQQRASTVQRFLDLILHV